VIAGGGVNVYTTETAPDEVATVPCVTEELMFTLNAAAKAALLTPPVALEPPVTIAPEDGPPVTVNVWLAGDHVTPPGPAGTNTTFTEFGPGFEPN
jgi:hypothetical protein